MMPRDIMSARSRRDGGLDFLGGLGREGVLRVEEGVCDSMGTRSIWLVYCLPELEGRELMDCVGEMIGEWAEWIRLGCDDTRDEGPAAKNVFRWCRLQTRCLWNASNGEPKVYGVSGGTARILALCSSSSSWMV